MNTFIQSFHNINVYTNITIQLIIQSGCWDFSEIVIWHFNI